MADAQLIGLNPGEEVTLDAPAYAPFRYWFVHNQSTVGTTVEVHSGQTSSSGSLIGKVSGGKMLGLPCREYEHLTFFVPSASTAPAEGDFAVVGCATAHLAPAGSGY